MKRMFLVIVLFAAFSTCMASTKVKVAKLGCYEAYLNQWSLIYSYFISDIRSCMGDVAISWIDFATDQSDPMTVVGSMMNMGCGFEALYRYDNSVKGASDALFACNGLAVTP